MKRLTVNPQHDQTGRQYSWALCHERLSVIENILGDDYDLDYLREAIEKKSEYEQFIEKWKQAVEIAGSVKQLGAERVAELVEADRDGRFVIVKRCSECKNHVEFGGKHYCKFWRMYCPNDSEFYCKAAMKGEQDG